MATRGWHGERKRHSEVVLKSKRKKSFTETSRVPMQKAIKPRKHFTLADAKRIGDMVGVNWSATPVKEFQVGLDIELEHGRIGGRRTNVTNDDDRLTGMIALIHVTEFPDYYNDETGLPAMERRLKHDSKRNSKKL